MAILSLDQSMANSGYLVVSKKSKYVTSGVICTETQKKKRNIGEMDDKCRRTNKILDELKDVIKTNSINLIICEEYAGYSQSKTAADTLAAARTIVVALSNLLEIPMVFVKAMDAKYALTKNKKASKNEMIDAAAKICPQAFEVFKSPRSKSGWGGKAEHVADAFGVYMAGKKLPLVQMALQR